MPINTSQSTTSPTTRPAFRRQPIASVTRAAPSETVWTCRRAKKTASSLTSDARHEGRPVQRLGDEIDASYLMTSSSRHCAARLCNSPPTRYAESARAPQMNAIVLIALKRPYTFVVLAILILIFGGRAVLSTPTDIFPNIGIPVVAVVWTYNGLTPEDMSGRVVYYYERALTTTVGNIEHIESQSLYGRGIVKIYFQPGTDVAAAQAQVTAVSQTVLKQMPAGITPPLVLSYNASSVPVLALQISSDQLTGSQLYDMASNLIRPDAGLGTGRGDPRTLWRNAQLTSRWISTSRSCWRTACRRRTYPTLWHSRTSCCRRVTRRSGRSISWSRPTRRR